MACDFCGEETTGICDSCGKEFCDEHGKNGVCQECEEDEDETEEEDMEEQHPDTTRT